MGKLAEKKVSMAKHILETQDEALLSAVEDLLNGGPFELSAAEKRELDASHAGHLAGDGKSTPWPEVKKRIQALVDKKLKR